MSYCVEFDRVSKSFVPGTLVLDEVTLNLPEGVTTAVVGESGSGKTTLLQLVNAVLRPDEGEIRVFGVPIPADLVSHRRAIGYSVQGAGLFPHMTNAANVQLLARLEGWSDEQMNNRFAELAGQMGLDVSIGDRYPQELSGGQQQRIGLCRALMLRPKMLLLDEPFSAVDPITRVGIYERFQEVQRHEGVSTLLVTHDMREAVKLASHLVIVRGGRIEQSGPISEVCEQPGTEYVANLLAQQL
jgi:osmoprotectant transport system ATP-binding protein